jgi:hypothetical protein
VGHDERRDPALPLLRADRIPVDPTVVSEGRGTPSIV